jgi:hypothetical protein
MRVLVKCGFREVGREEGIVLPALGGERREAVVFEVSSPEA